MRRTLIKDHLYFHYKKVSIINYCNIFGIKMLKFYPYDFFHRQTFAK